MKRTLSTEQLPTPSQKQDSGLLVTLLPGTAVEQTQSEPTLFNFIAAMYADGTGVEKDEKEALQWYLKAAEQGYVEALFKVGLVYDNGAGVEVDEEQALKWYFKAAEQGHVEAQFTVGNMYRDGVGVDVNKEDALKWYLKAARQGHPRDFAEIYRALVASGEHIGQLSSVLSRLGRRERYD